MKMRITVSVRCPNCYREPMTEQDAKAFAEALARGQRTCSCGRCGRVNPTNTWLDPMEGAAATTNERMAD